MDYPKKENDWRLTYGMGDASDMTMMLDIYDPTTGCWDYMDAIRVLSVERCTEKKHLSINI